MLWCTIWFQYKTMLYTSFLIFVFFVLPGVPFFLFMLMILFTNTLVSERYPCIWCSCLSIVTWELSLVASWVDHQVLSGELSLVASWVDHQVLSGVLSLVASWVDHQVLSGVLSLVASWVDHQVLSGVLSLVASWVDHQVLSGELSLVASWVDHQVFSRVRIAQCLGVFDVFCRCLFVPFFFSFSVFCCLSVSYITPLLRLHNHLIK